MGGGDVDGVRAFFLSSYSDVCSRTIGTLPTVFLTNYEFLEPTYWYSTVRIRCTREERKAERRNYSNVPAYDGKIEEFSILHARWLNLFRAGLFAFSVLPWLNSHKKREKKTFWNEV